MNEIIEVKQADMLTAINRSEVDIQIATAKQYPRNIQQALANIKAIATLDKTTAEDCFYAVSRGGQTIEGVSVRLAEIIAGQWGNLRVQTRIIGNDGRTITVQGVCHDLETNLAVSVEVKRSIVNKQGQTYSQDMQVVTGNAASAIAFRNAVLKVIPKAVTSRVIEEVRSIAKNIAPADLKNTRNQMIVYFGTQGISQAMLLSYCGVTKPEDITEQKIFELRGLINAVKEGTTTLQEVFKEHTPDSKAIAAQARKQAKAKQDKIANAMQAATFAPSDTQAQTVDPETGEIKNTATEPSK